MTTWRGEAEEANVGARTEKLVKDVGKKRNHNGSTRTMALPAVT